MNEHPHRMYTGETSDEFYARRAPLESLWNGMVGGLVANFSVATQAKNRHGIEEDATLARAEALGIPVERVREIALAEMAKARTGSSSFSWGAVRSRMEQECQL